MACGADGTGAAAGRCGRAAPAPAEILGGGARMTWDPRSWEPLACVYSPGSFAEDVDKGLSLADLYVLGAFARLATTPDGYVIAKNGQVREYTRHKSDRGLQLVVDKLRKACHLVSLVEVHGKNYANIHVVLTGRPERSQLLELVQSGDVDGEAAYVGQLRRELVIWLDQRGLTFKVLPPNIRAQLGIEDPPARGAGRPRRQDPKSSSGFGREGNPKSSSGNARPGYAKSSSGNRPPDAKSSSGIGDANPKDSSSNPGGPQLKPEEFFAENPQNSDTPGGSSVVVVHSELKEQQQHPGPTVTTGSADADNVSTQLSDDLVALGVTPSVATDLTAHYPSERIQAVLTAVRTRRPNNPPAWAVSALRKEWAVEASGKAAGARRSRRETKPDTSETAARSPEQVALEAFEQHTDQVYSDLPPDDQAALRDAALHIVGGRFDAKFAASSQIGAALVQTELRKLVAERFGIPVPGDNEEHRQPAPPARPADPAAPPQPAATAPGASTGSETDTHRVAS